MIRPMLPPRSPLFALKSPFSVLLVLLSGNQEFVIVPTPRLIGFYAAPCFTCRHEEHAKETTSKTVLPRGVAPCHPTPSFILFFLFPPPFLLYLLSLFLLALLCARVECVCSAGWKEEARVLRHCDENFRINI